MRILYIPQKLPGRIMTISCKKKLSFQKKCATTQCLSSYRNHVSANRKTERMKTQLKDNSTNSFQSSMYFLKRTRNIVTSTSILMSISLMMQGMLFPILFTLCSKKPIFNLRESFGQNERCHSSDSPTYCNPWNRCASESTYSHS